MVQRHAVKCIECKQVYAAEVSEEGLLLPTKTGVCTCGTAQFWDLTTETRIASRESAIVAERVKSRQTQ